MKKKIQRKECIECAKKLEYDLKERIKELECLYNISSLIESGKNLNQILENSTVYLVKGFQYPEKACAEIVFEQTHYSHQSFLCEKTQTSLQAENRGQ